MEDFDIEKVIEEDFFAKFDADATAANNVDPTSDIKDTASEANNLVSNFDADENERNSGPDPDSQGQATAPKTNLTDLPILQDFDQSLAETKALLIQWDLEHLTPIIEAHKLDLLALIYIKERHFDQIAFETLGDKVKLEHHVLKFQKDQLLLTNVEGLSREIPQTETRVNESRNEAHILPESSVASTSTSSELAFKFQSVSITVEFNKL